MRKVRRFVSIIWELVFIYLGNRKSSKGGWIKSDFCCLNVSACIYNTFLDGVYEVKTDRSNCPTFKLGEKENISLALHTNVVSELFLSQFSQSVVIQKT